MEQLTIVEGSQDLTLLNMGSQFNSNEKGKWAGDSISFISYNMTGADTYKCQWLRDLMSDYTINFCLK